MTIQEILDHIYSFEDIMATSPRKEDSILIGYLTCITKMIAKFDIKEEMFETDFEYRKMSDGELKFFCDFLHNEKLYAERELYKRNLS